MILCEGRQTEPRYFRSLCRHRRLGPIRVEVVGPGAVPRTLVATARASQLRASATGNAYAEVWCVFDCDDHPGLPDLLGQTLPVWLHYAFSNPCFELWYLLHFRYSTAHIERDKAASELSTLLRGGYEKNRPDVYAVLLDSQPTALAIAERLRSHHDAVNEGRPENPWTNVDRLVTALNALADTP